MSYSAPLQDMLFVLNDICDAGQLAHLPQFADATPDTVAAILDEAGSFTGGVLAPLNRAGDKAGARLTADGVKTTAGWTDAYAQFIAGGWNGVMFAPEWGGMGLPWLVGAAVQEMLNAANMSFALCPLLTQGAIEAIVLNGSDALRATYVPKMVSGEWTGTMNLTEPQAGSDLAAVRTRAVRDGAHYRITGQKIFITYGDHDLTDNIIHLVLARLPDAPEGVKGISLFVVPKRLVNADGKLGAANDLRCVSLEHKIGIHGSPTAVMSFGDHGGAIGYLVGEENRGLEYMFVMMNRARLSVGIQGLGIADRSYQHALAYATSRVQGRIVGDRSGGAKPIVHHPDVHRMVMTMRSSCEAMRGLCYSAALSLDLSHAAATPAERAAHQARLDLLIPVAKAWCTETACDVTSLGVQIHGGMGYIEETGAAQYFRDSRITTIYEGTTGIQANDLIGRKLQRDGGAAARALVAELIATADALAAHQDKRLSAIEAAVRSAADDMSAIISWLIETAAKEPVRAAGAAVNVLHLFGLAISGGLLAQGAAKAADRLAAGETAPLLTEKIAVAHFFAGQRMPDIKARRAAITDPNLSALALYGALS
ncbi:MAG: acyl-CoA dehydrogenase [Hyphomicrobium sp.]